MSEKIVRYYIPENNPEGLHLSGGVPLDNIPESRWASFPKHIQASIDAWEIDGRKVYHMTRPAKAATKETKPERAGPKRKTKPAIVVPVVARPIEDAEPAGVIRPPINEVNEEATDG
jgi:hypothetical protein